MPSITRSTLLVGALSAFAAAQKTTAACADVVVFMARGNDAPYQPDGRTFIFEQTLCSKVAPKSCDYMDVVFDATLGAPYCPQIDEGRRNLVSQVTSFHAKCPNSEIVINGYSEGAMVTTDALGGGGFCGDNGFVPLDPNSPAGKSIAAVLVWGDVQHTANQPYNVLDGADKQAAPRTGANLASLNRWSSVLRSYCAAGDPVCAGGNDVQQHLNYFQLYTNSAVDWTIQMVEKKAPAPSSSAAPSASASASASASGSASASASASVSASASGSASASSSGAASGSGHASASGAGAGYGSGYATASGALPTTIHTSVKPYPTAGKPSSVASSGEGYATAPAVKPTTTYPVGSAYPVGTETPVAAGACHVVYEVVHEYVTEKAY